MQEVLAISLRAMHDDMQRLDRISTNMANVLTPGYKREIVASTPLRMGSVSFPSVVSQMSSSALSSKAGVPSFSPVVVHSDMRPGTLKSTGQSLDVAIAGPGYFEVQTANGPAYTRQGNFNLDARGRLVTAQGYPVMGKGGEIYLNGPRPVIDATGNVYEDAKLSGIASTDRLAMSQGRADSQAIAQLKVVEFEDTKQVHRMGDGLVTGGNATNALKDTDVQLRQGYLENANVSAMHEMVELMQTMRHFESMQKIALGYDDMTGQAIRKLGDLS